MQTQGNERRKKHIRCVSRLYFAKNIFDIFRFYIRLFRLTAMIHFLADGFKKADFFIPYRYFVIELSIFFYNHVFWLVEESVVYGKKEIGDDHFVF